MSMEVSLNEKRGLECDLKGDVTGLSPCCYRTVLVSSRRIRDDIGGQPPVEDD
jgi:hypothetical protein